MPSGDRFPIRWSLKARDIAIMEVFVLVSDDFLAPP